MKMKTQALCGEGSTQARRCLPIGRTGVGLDTGVMGAVPPGLKAHNSVFVCLWHLPICCPSIRAQSDCLWVKRISFYKWAQILVACTWNLLEVKGDNCLKYISNISMFADHRLLQVLVHLGALKYSDELLEKVLKGEMLLYGNRQEWSLWRVELI